MSIRALNLVKNKKDSLQKRLGFTKLNPENSSSDYVNTKGIALGTHLDKLVVFGTGLLSLTPSQQINTISVYSDNLAATEPQHVVPEVIVSEKKLAVPAVTLTWQCSCTSYLDYIVMAWITGPTTSGSGGDTRSLFYQIVEASTMNIVTPATEIANIVNDPASFRIFMVGTNAVIVVSDSNNGSIKCVVCKFGSGGTSPASFSNSYSSISTGIHTSEFNPYGWDAYSVAGDTTYFALAYGQSGTNAIHIAAVNPLNGSIHASDTVVDAVFSAGAHDYGTIGLVGDTTTNKVAIAYSFVNGIGQTTVSAAVASNWPTLGTTVPGSALFTSTSKVPMPASSIGVANLGSVDDGFGTFRQMWGVWFNTPGTNLSGTGSFNTTNDYVTTNLNTAFPSTYFLEFYLSGTTPTLVSTGNMPRTTWGSTCISRPLMSNGVPFILTYCPSLLQGSYYLCAADFYSNNTLPNYNPMRPVGTIAPRQCLSDHYSTTVKADTVVPNTIPADAAVGTARYVTNIAQVTTLGSSVYAITVITTVNGSNQIPSLYFIDFDSPRLYTSAMYGRSLAIGCGVPSLYDGCQTSEISFCYYPEMLPIETADIAASINGGPWFHLPTDVVNYIATYEWTDTQDQRHISARSPVKSVTGQMVLDAGVELGLPVSVTLRIPALGLGYKALFAAQGFEFSNAGLFSRGAPVEMCLYRTAINGTVYHRVTDPQLIWDSQTGTGHPLDDGSDSVENKRTGFTTFIDILFDNQSPIDPSFPFLTANPVLYGDGSDGTTGNIDNLIPPSSSIICQHKGRIFLADGNLLWYSKALTPGEGPGFNETSMIFSVGDQTPITGLASMDDKIIIFKRRNIYYVAGDGPEDNGTQNDFTPPQPIPTELGCVDQRSIVVTPSGAYFYSDAGYRLLDRSLTVQYVGTAVENETDAYPYMIGAVLHPSKNRLIATISSVNSGNGTGEWLSLDYILDAWTTGQLVNDEGDPRGPTAVGVGMAPRTVLGVPVYEPTLHFLFSDGTLWREKQDTEVYCFMDTADSVNSYVSSSFQTSFIKPSESIDGFNKVWAVNAIQSFDDNCSYTIKTYNDYATSATDTKTWGGPSEMSFPGLAQTFPLQVYKASQRLSSVKIEISDAAPTDGSSVVNGGGFQLIGITMDVGTYPAAARVPAANRK